MQQTKTKLSQIVENFNVSTETLLILARQILESMENGLFSKPNNNNLQISTATHTKQSNSCALGMYPTFVTKFPTGHEIGTYLAVDLGGTNFRMSIIQLTDNSKGTYSILSQFSTNIPEKVKKGSGTHLFDFIANSIKEFLSLNNQFISLDSNILMGFTFSYPVRQNSINHGELLEWSKEIDCPDVIWQDVVDLLQRSFDNLGLNITVVALLNDTVATLIANKYTDPSTKMGIIFGTGTNCAYIESVENIQKLTGHKLTDCMAINIEWGTFTSINLPITYFDIEVDKASLYPGKQIFEKMISGLYLGEIAKAAMIEAGLLTNHEGKSIHLDASCMSIITDPTSGGNVIPSSIREYEEMVEKKKQIFSKVGWRDEDLEEVESICSAILIRAARLAASGIVAVAQRIFYNNQISKSHSNARDCHNSKMESEDVIVGAVDGSLYCGCALFRNSLLETIDELIQVLGIPLKINLFTGKYSSCLGAAIVACTHYPIE